jgi:hypothetical protein
MQWAGHYVVFQMTLGQGCTHVRTGIVDRAIVSSIVKHRDTAFTHFVRTTFPLRNFVAPRNHLKVVLQSDSSRRTIMPSIIGGLTDESRAATDSPI